MVVNSASILPSLSMFFIGLVVLWLWKNKFKTKRAVILWGAVAWIASIAVKILVATLFNQTLYTALFPAEPYGPIIYYIYIGLLTGIFEIFIPLYILLKKKGLLQLLSNTRSQLGFGISFGCTEAVILGIVGIINFAVVASAGIILPASVLDLYSQATDVYALNALYSGVERLLAIVIHLFSTMLIFFYIFRKKISYLASTVVYKTFVDGITAFFLLSPIIFSLELVEGFFAIIAIISLIILRQMLKQSRVAKRRRKIKRRNKK